MEQIEYEGRWISVDVTPDGKGWKWTYQIEGGALRACEDRSLGTEQAMRDDAVFHAKAEIDRAKKLKN